MGVEGLFILLSTLQYMQGIQGSALLDSLTCVNDYKTHWSCQWKLKAEAHALLPMNLIQWSDMSSSHICEPEDSGKIKDGEVHMNCQINEKFTYLTTTTFTFQPKHDVSKNTRLNPNYNVRMPPPEGLMVQKSGSKNGSITLRWRIPNNISYNKLLLYQVTYYRKDWESWEDAAVLHVIGKTEVSFSPQLFVPGSTYLFRVRSVPDEEQQYRSAWSNSLEWMMPEEEDKAIPQNLHCEYDGSAQMRCSWEVRKELSSIPYMLYYKDGNSNDTTKTHGGNPCNNLSSQIKDRTSYVLYSCTFPIRSSQANSSVHIQVRPQEEHKELKACKNIQTKPPSNLQIKDPLNYKYKLGWSPPVVTYSTIKLTYQLCYWKQGEEECPDLSLVTVSGNVPEYYIPSSEIWSSTNYIAKVRARPDGGSGYSGPWSDWSQSYSWKTDKALSKVAIGVSTFFTFVGILLCIYLSFICLKRLKKQWESSIPDARKSKLSNFPPGYQSPNYPHFISREFYAKVEGPLVPLQISPIESPPSIGDASEEFLIKATSELGASPLGPYSMVPSTTEKGQPHQASCKLPDIEETYDLRGTSISQRGELLSKMVRDSPYFICTEIQSMSDLLAKESKSSEYFMPLKCQSKVLSPPTEFIPSCQTISPRNPMSYVLSMENPPPLQTPLKNNDNKQESKKSSYFAIPSPSDVQVPQEGPLMVINPEGSGPVVLKQVGDYCFFPGIHGSQENLEKKLVPTNAKMHPQVPKDAPLPAVQAFKVMQRDYLALPQN